MTRLQWRCGILSVLFALAGCGSAAEYAGDYNPAEATDGSGAPVTLASYEVVIDPIQGQFQYTPVNAVADMAQTLAFSHENADYLSQTANVTLGNGWYTYSYDLGAFALSLFEDNRNGTTGSCLQINEGGKTARNLKAKFWGFNPSTVTATDGAYQPSGTNYYTVDYQDVVPSTTFCRNFSLANVNGGAFRFLLNFEADSIDSNATAAYLQYGNYSYWSNELPDTAKTMTGFGFGTVAANAKTMTYLDPDGPSGSTPATDLYPTYYATNSRSATAFSVSTFTAPAANGYFQGVTRFNGTLTGPYIRTNPQLKAAISAISTSSSSTATYIIWFVCTQGASCPNPALTGGCVTDSKWFTDIERQSGLTIGDLTTGITAYFSNLTTAAVGGTDRIYIAYDDNGDHQIGSGDKYYVTPANQTVVAGSVLTLASVSFVGSVTVACGY